MQIIVFWLVFIGGINRMKKSVTKGPSYHILLMSFVEDLKRLLYLPTCIIEEVKMSSNLLDYFLSLRIEKKSPNRKNINIMKTRSLIILVVLLLSTYYSPIFSQSEHTHPRASIFNQLERDGILEITIKTDLTELLSGEGKKGYIPTQLHYKDQSGKNIKWSMESRLRGKFRRRVCDFPPIKLRFDKDDLSAKGLSSFHTLKLVTHCLEDSYLSKTTVLKEYLAYQMYEELTDKSLKTQLVKVTYVDSQNKKSKIKRYGFIIENHHEMANRLEASICDCMNPDMEQMNKQQDLLNAMFQYMIGNEDWDIRMARNVKLVQPTKGAALYAVPYDFDFAGMVDANYAVPNPDLGLATVKERFYQGYYTEKVEIEAVLDYFQLKKDKLYQIVNDFKFLDGLSRRKVKKYLDEFFLEMEYDTIVGNNMPLEVSK